MVSRSAGAGAEAGQGGAQVAAVEAEHDRGEHAGDHEGHQHGPILNPECVREVKIEAPVEEVDKALEVKMKYRAPGQ